MTALAGGRLPIGRSPSGIAGSVNDLEAESHSRLGEVFSQVRAEEPVDRRLFTVQLFLTNSLLLGLVFGSFVGDALVRKIERSLLDGGDRVLDLRARELADLVLEDPRRRLGLFSTLRFGPRLEERLADLLDRLSSRARPFRASAGRLRRLGRRVASGRGRCRTGRTRP